MKRLETHNFAMSGGIGGRPGGSWGGADIVGQILEFSATYGRKSVKEDNENAAAVKYWYPEIHLVLPPYYSSENSRFDARIPPTFGSDGRTESTDAPTSIMICCR
jgi:hypothetical protein